MELQNKSDETEKQVREVIEKGLQLQIELMNLTKELGALSAKEGKYTEQIDTFKLHKKFLDLLAISAGKKQIRPQVKQKSKDEKELEAEAAHHSGRQKASETFQLTEVNNRKAPTVK